MWGSFGGRGKVRGEYLCICVCARPCWGPQDISIKMSCALLLPPSSSWGFSLLRSVTAPHFVCFRSSSLAGGQDNQWIPSLSPAVQISACLLPLHPFIHLLCPPSLHPSGLRLLNLTFHPMLGAFHRSGETEVRGTGGESGASSNLISQRRLREEGPAVTRDSVIVGTTSRSFLETLGMNTHTDFTLGQNVQYLELESIFYPGFLWCNSSAILCWTLWLASDWFIQDTGEQVSVRLSCLQTVTCKWRHYVIHVCSRTHCFVLDFVLCILPFSNSMFIIALKIYSNASFGCQLLLLFFKGDQLCFLEQVRMGL